MKFDVVFPIQLDPSKVARICSTICALLRDLVVSITVLQGVWCSELLLLAILDVYMHFCWVSGC